MGPLTVERIHTIRQIDKIESVSCALQKLHRENHQAPMIIYKKNHEKLPRVTTIEARHG